MLARLGTVPGDLEPVAPQEAFLNRLEDLLVVRTRHVDARTMLKHVAGEVDGEGESVTRATMIDLDERIAALDAAIEALIAGDPEQAERYRILISIPGVGPVTAAALLCWMPELGSLEGRQAALIAGGAGCRAPWCPAHPRRTPQATRSPVHGRHHGVTLQSGSRKGDVKIYVSVGRGYSLW